ncbi:hypothetical protein D3C84_1150180 [compost metagenome]
MEVAFATVIQFQGQAHRLAQQLVERDRPVFGGQVQFVVEQSPQLFAAFHALQQQDIAAERTVDLYQTVVLRNCHERLPWLGFGRQLAVVKKVASHA